MIPALIKAKLILTDVTPLGYDCGTLCQNACCKPDTDGQGTVALFPGEEEELRGVKWGSVQDGVLTCLEPCDRAKRPMGCRIFPLSPALKNNGTWAVRMDSRARAMCPLYRFGLKGLSAKFVSGVARALNVMADDESLNAFLREWEKGEREFRKACDELAGGINA